MAFHLTPAAAQEILAAASRSGDYGMALRVAAKPTADGIAYGMGFDEAAPGDEIAEFDGLTVLVAPESQRWLDTTVLDYVELEAGRHDFIFVPPGEPQGSGCATTAKGCGGGSCSGCR
jgi:iron-sulfur cluster assembly protein